MDWTPNEETGGWDAETDIGTYKIAEERFSYSLWLYYKNSDPVELRDGDTEREAKSFAHVHYNKFFR